MTDHGLVLAGALVAFGLAIGLGAIGAAFGDGLAGKPSSAASRANLRHKEG
jgi:hypothetical protein